jgi:hypothetical protein
VNWLVSFWLQAELQPTFTKFLAQKKTFVLKVNENKSTFHVNSEGCMLSL